MIRAIWLLVLVLAVPLISGGVAWLVQLKLGLEFYYSYSPISRSIWEACLLTADTVPAGCPEYKAAGILSWTAAVSAWVGVGLLVGIAVLGYLARFSRVVLLLAFTIGLPLTNLLLVILLITQGVLIVFSLHLGTTVLADRSLPILTLAAGAGALFGAVALIRASLTTVKTNDMHALGLGLLKAEHPALWTMIDGLAAKLGVTPPRYVIVGLDPTFYVTEQPVQCLNGASKGRILYLSLPLCRILTQGEFAAVIGHELGHFRGNDLWFTRRFYPIYQGTMRSLEELHGAADSLVQMIPLYPAVAILTLFFESFSRALRARSAATASLPPISVAWRPATAWSLPSRWRS